MLFLESVETGTDGTDRVMGVDNDIEVPRDPFIDTDGLKTGNLSHKSHEHALLSLWVYCPVVPVAATLSVDIEKRCKRRLTSGC